MVLPFLLYLKTLQGDWTALGCDTQVQWFLTTVVVIILVTAGWLCMERGSEIAAPLAAVDEELTRIVTAIRRELRLEAPRETEEAPPDPVSIEGLPILIESLEAKRGVVAELSSTLTINEIEDFAVQMEALGKEHSYPPLVSWGQRLAECATGFDMDGISRELNEYSLLVEGIRRAEDS